MSVSFATTTERTISLFGVGSSTGVSSTTKSGRIVSSTLVGSEVDVFPDHVRVYEVTSAENSVVVETWPGVLRLAKESS